MAKEQESTGSLTVVATPIGNLEDLTFRALRMLRDADFILAEDTRHTRKLLTHYELRTPLRAFHAHSRAGEIQRICDELRNGAQVALVSDAGSPVISDPGMELLSAVAEAGLKITVAPGPSAVTSSLALAALPAARFRFLGFLPRKGGKRQELLKSLRESSETAVLFESPNRVLHTLEELQQYLPKGRLVALCREISKIHEQAIRGTPAEVIGALPEQPRGEMTLVVAGRPETEEKERPSEEELQRILQAWFEDEGLSRRDAAQRLSEDFGISRKEAYQLALKGKSNDYGH